MTQMIDLEAIDERVAREIDIQRCVTPNFHSQSFAYEMQAAKIRREGEFIKRIAKILNEKQAAGELISSLN
jgi:hypothetical protein